MADVTINGEGRRFGLEGVTTCVGRRRLWAGRRLGRREKLKEGSGARSTAVSSHLYEIVFFFLLLLLHLAPFWNMTKQE